MFAYSLISAFLNFSRKKNAKQRRKIASVQIIDGAEEFSFREFKRSFNSAANRLENQYTFDCGNLITRKATESITNTVRNAMLLQADYRREGKKRESRLVFE